MPLIEQDGKLALACVNRGLVSHAGEGGMKSAGAYALQCVANDPRAPRVAMLVPQTFAPVLVYACHICGYTELYSAQVVDSKAWGEPKVT